MTLTKLKELRDQVRGLTGPDREVDARLCVTFQYMPAYDGVPLNLRCAVDQGLGIGPIWLDYDVDEDGRVVGCTDTAPVLTGSTDAAFAFSEKVLPDKLIRLSNEYMGYWAATVGRSTGRQRLTAALAIIDATLTALIETME